ncbi:hypothetical protein FALCPG4_000628 [Fusarium falciforme]
METFQFTAVKSKSRYLSEFMTIQPNDQPAFYNKETSQHVSVYQLVTELVELVPATLSSWIMSAYMRQFHPTYIAWPQAARVDVLAQPSQWLALTACLVYGCSIASFLHRRRFLDPYQPFIFAACVSLGAVLGKCTGASADYILLVHVSWATCLAMFASVICLRIGYVLS